MKHQYFGDINDYRKYGILRALSDQDIKITICWMLTKSDNRSDGRHIHYLEQAAAYQKYDPVLFDSLHTAVIQKKKRNVSWVDTLDLVPSAQYHTTLLTDEQAQRACFFQELAAAAKKSDLVFFDPDNGIEVKSTQRGKRNSCKYLYWDEIQKFWELGYSLLIYQHFPRVNRLEYILSRSKELRSNIGATKIVTFKTSTVAFFLLVQTKHRKKIHSTVEFIRERWEGMIEVS